MRNRQGSLIASLIALLGAAALGLVACNSSAPPPAPAAATASAATPFKAVLDTKQLMGWVIDPSAGAVWQSVGTSVTEAGEENKRPTTDEQWNAVRNHAAIVAESGNLLMLAGRSQGGDWNAKAVSLIEAANEVIKATEVKDAEALFTAGGELYQACTDCHAVYLAPPTTK